MRNITTLTQQYFGNMCCIIAKIIVICYSNHELSVSYFYTDIQFKDIPHVPDIFVRTRCDN